jgi:hypothetical protein
MATVYNLAAITPIFQTKYTTQLLFYVLSQRIAKQEEAVVFKNEYFISKFHYNIESFILQ